MRSGHRIMLPMKKMTEIEPPPYDRAGLMAAIKAQFRVNWHGVHGPSHWARVRHHSIHLATVRHGDLLVAELFSYLHDSQRENEWTDPGHGERAAEYAVSLNTRFFDLAPSQLDLLTNASLVLEAGREALL
jgi:uncharacterized protein